MPDQGPTETARSPWLQNARNTIANLTVVPDLVDLSEEERERRLDFLDDERWEDHDDAA